ncbi:MAG TPA: CoA transferase [Candidatus Sulfotelmatobacter sp.]|nr:CoA transferase [Candidatus Sulfotelmatobacter sp.]
MSVSAADRTDNLPLAGIRVIDIATILGGPVAATYLADFGAEVIKVEEPKTGDLLRQFGRSLNGVPLGWLQEARNKKSITLNLRSAEGQALLKRLVADADVVIENFRPGTLAQWNLDYPVLAKLNPRLVMLHVSGYGQTGPYRRRGAFDRVVSAFAGLTYTSGFADGPPVRQSYPVADYMAAALGAFAIMMVLYQRDRTGGPGQEIDLALYEGLFRSSGAMLLAYEKFGEVPTRTGNSSPGVCPAGNYQTADNIWVTIHAGTDALWRRIAGVMRQPELAEDPRYATSRDRQARHKEVEGLVALWVAKQPAASLLAALEQADVPAERLYTIADIAADPHYRERNIATLEDARVGALSMIDVLPKLSRTPGRVRWAGPDKGQHNGEIYGERLGLPPAELERLRRDGVI